MIPSRVIEQKRDGGAIDGRTLEAFLAAFLDGSVQDYQMSAFLMAVFHRGLDADETEVFVRVMLASGSVLDLSHLPGPRVDKHSTGGVGDKVSLVLAPLAAAMGIFVPMMSGRGLGHTAGTLDKLEAIPGFRTDLSLDEFRIVLEDVGCAMIGQTEEIAPLDRRLYALRDVTATVPIRSLIAASIMSKKLAEGLTGLLLDVKVGAGAFIPQEDGAIQLAQTMVDIGVGRGLPTVALLTAMDRPLGYAIGNTLETAEAIRCLRGEGPGDLRAIVRIQAAEMLRLAEPRLAEADALERAESALASGAALERFVRLVEAQGGDTATIDDPDRLSTAPERKHVLADTSGVVLGVAPKVLGQGVVALGGGRVHMDQQPDLGVGFQMHVQPGDHVSPGDRLGTVHARDADGALIAANILRSAVTVGNAVEAAELRPLVSHRVDEDGVRLTVPRSVGS
ncbi:MAG TPA: thymidine phosphorylase [Gemmatimonadetes bacterium]|nr:thymidine phosphorylase [Gemmatimonadota bacterium]